MDLAKWIWRNGFGEMDLVKLFWPNEWIWRNGFGQMDEFGEMDFGEIILAKWIWRNGFGEMDLAKWIW